MDITFAPRKGDLGADANPSVAKPVTVPPPSWAFGLEGAQPRQQPPPSGPWAPSEHVEGPPANASELVQDLVALTACSEAHARQLLQNHMWNLEASADAFYVWGAKNSIAYTAFDPPGLDP